MALRYLEGFESWSPYGQSQGRYGGLSWFTDFYGWYFGYGALVVPLDDQQTLITGAALKYDDFTSGGNGDFPIFQFQDNGTIQAALYYNSAGDFLVYQGDKYTGALLGSGGRLIGHLWTYVEMKCMFGAAGSGSIEVRQDGQLIITLHGLNNTRTGRASANVAILSNGRVYNALMDDVYVCDGTGTGLNDFLGEIRVDTAFPIGAGSHSNFISSSASLNWMNVDDSYQRDYSQPFRDGDADYNYSNVLGAIDIYPTTLLNYDANILAVLPTWYARKDAASLRQLKVAARQGTIDYVLGSAHNLGSAYDFNQEILINQPDGSPWTRTAINATQFGIKITS